MKNRIKVLFIANRPDLFSGGQISLVELVSNIDKSRFDIAVLCPGEGTMSEKLEQNGINVILWDMPRPGSLNIFRTLSVIGNLKDIINENGFDIVHTNGVRAQIYASFAVRNTCARLVWHVRESVKDIFFLDLILEKMSDRIICVSRKALEEKFGPSPRGMEKFNIIYNGVDVDLFRKDNDEGNSFRYELDAGDKDILIGMVGLIEPLKGHKILLDALKIIKDKYPGIKLIVAGKTVDNEYEQFLKDTAREYGFYGDLIFTGQRGDIVRLLSALDMFVLPSRREGFSRALIEAMSCSLPVVATDAGGNSEALDDGVSGLLVPFGDHVKLAGAIERIISDKQFSEGLSLKARARVEDKFSMDKHVRMIEGLYEDLAGEEKCV